MKLEDFCRITKGTIDSFEINMKELGLEDLDIDGWMNTYFNWAGWDFNTRITHEEF